MAKETDINLLENFVGAKSWNIEDSEGNVYDFNDTAGVEFNIIEHNTINVLHTINASFDTSTGRVTVSFDTNHTSTPGYYDYQLVETKNNGNKMYLQLGNLSIEQLEGLTTGIDAFIRSETPANLSIVPNFKNQKIKYWQSFLSILTNPIKTNPHNEASWSILEKALIGKLVIYEALLLATKGSYVGFINATSKTDTSTQSSGGVKSITTGPTSVEFHDVSSSVSSMMKPNGPAGLSAFDKFKEDLCILAKRLRISLPMCPPLNEGPVIPKVHR